ncbi:MAG: ferritin-like domain-containing protein [bacterium]
MQRFEQEDVGRTATVGTIAELSALTSRREFMRLIGIGGALVMLPGMFAACEDGSNTAGLAGPGTGASVTIDFAAGDTALLQFAYVLEQLEADFYSRVVSNFAGSSFKDADKVILTDIRDHEIIHREFLKSVLGGSANFTLAPTYGSLNFKDRATVLAAAKTFEDLGVAAYNGAAQYYRDPNNLLASAKIVSVEARHAAAIRDLITPASAEFAPSSFDDTFSLDKVAFAVQGSIDDMLVFANAPATFVDGPNKTGSV